jgi:uncharacterized heparinase superfamily protein
MSEPDPDDGRSDAMTRPAEQQHPTDIPSQPQQPTRGFGQRLLALVGGTAAPPVAITPPDSEPGDKAAGEAVLMHGVRFDQPAEPPDVDAHAFEWLRDLRAVRSGTAQEAARRLTEEWMLRYGRPGGRGWSPQVAADRLIQWLGAYRFLTSGANTELTAQIDDSIGRHVRALGKAVGRMVQDARRFRVLKALIYAGICAPGRGRPLERALAQLDAEIGAQIAPDGGHLQRNPLFHAAVFADLVETRAALGLAQHSVPSWLQHGIDRMAPVLRMLRHGDGTLGLFNGATEGEPEALDQILAAANAEGRALASAPHVGFERLDGGATMALVDAGMPPPYGLDRVAHAGTLSFEMGAGGQRMIVNCGGYGGADQSWRAVARTTAAHSTLTVEDTNSNEVFDGGGLGKRLGEVVCRRDQHQGADWIDAAHDGYVKRFGMTHRRRLFLAADGHQMRGEDVLVGSRGNHDFAIRFHLHPAVDATIAFDSTLDQRSVRLQLPDGQAWAIQAGGENIGIEDSVYLGRPGKPVPTRQAVITGSTSEGDGRQVNWVIKRIEAAAPKAAE